MTGPSQRDLERRLNDLEGTDEEDTPFWMRQVPPSKRGNRTEAWRYLLKEAESDT
jgi:hypothetical protein